jgi:hypothetical protein
MVRYPRRNLSIRPGDPVCSRQAAKNPYFEGVWGLRSNLADPDTTVIVALRPSLGNQINWRKRLHQTAERSRAPEEVRPEHRTGLEDLGVQQASREAIATVFDGQALTNTRELRASRTGCSSGNYATTMRALPPAHDAVVRGPGCFEGLAEPYLDREQAAGSGSA